MSRPYREGQRVKLLNTGIEVTIIEVLPVAQRVFYRIEFENGDRSLVIDTKLRSLQLIADKE